MSRYDQKDDYCYPGTSVLRNKLDIRDQSKLDAYEADVTALRMMEAYRAPLPGNFDFDYLCRMHRHVFQDVYDWAGQVRTVDLSRGTSRFANQNYIVPYLEKALSPIGADDFHQALPPELFIQRLAHYMSEINAVHPFRDGNGRVQRLFCGLLAERAGYFVDFDAISRDEMYDVMIRSFNNDEQSLAALLFKVTSMVES